MARRRWLLGIAFGLVAMIPARPVAAHSSVGASDFRTEFTEVTGSLNGVELTVKDLGARLEIERTTAAVVVVLGYEGEPYLRLDGDGVWRNLASPATYLNADRYANVTPPAIADPTAVPQWEQLSTESRFSWHDHRAHWMSTAEPPIASSEPNVEHVVYEDEIELVIDGRAVSVGTRVTWVPRPPQTMWWITLAVIGVIATAGGVRWPRAVAYLGMAAPVFGLVTRPAGIGWLIAGLTAVAAGSIGLGRRSAHLAGVAGLGAVMMAASRLDVLEHSLLPGSVPPTLQRLGIVLAIGTGAGALVGALVAPARSVRRASGPLVAG